ncbi:MAG: adenylylsulfate kinase [Frankiaceae bacterium]|jgi:adenylylsulfate kinase|nr:adenylylsulfate kinase [Frankiaceae bacterium]
MTATDSPSTRGATLWFTGLPSAGKTTVARALADRLRADGRRVELLDGDEVRPHLSQGLGYSKEDRDINVTRIGYVARLLARNGVLALVPVVAPYRATRDTVRAEHDANGAAYLEIFVSTPLDVCADRDVKGLYAKAARGEMSGMTGVDDPYEPPLEPDVELPTQELPLAESVDRLYDALRERGLL